MQTVSRAETTGFRAIWDADTDQPKRGSVGKVVLADFDGCHDVLFFVSDATGESIVIRDDIIIRVVNIQGHRVRLGIEAPKEVPVHRKELQDAIRRSESSEANQEIPSP